MKVKPGDKSAAGPTLLERLWDELDSIMDRLMEEGEPKLPTRNYEYPINSKTMKQISKEWMEYGEERGRAQATAYAIAIIESPYSPSVPRVKERAVERWHDRQK